MCPRSDSFLLKGPTKGSPFILFLLLTLASTAQAAAPTISSLIAPGGVASGPVGTPVTISGKNFGASQGTSTVKFNGTTAVPTSWSDSTIEAPVPAGATTGNVVVTVSGRASNGVTFTVIPNITSLSPTNGTAGTSVTIAGTTFGTTQGSSTVKFNGTAATPTSWSSTSIVATVPSGATTGNVLVTVSGQPSNGMCFAIPSIPCGAFTFTGSLSDARTAGNTATLLNSGMVLITGGYNCGIECGLDAGANNYAELYNPATGTFIATGSMNTARFAHTATLLSNGMVLIAGGTQFNNTTGTFSSLSSAELYNPATGAFSATGSLNTGRYGHTATLLSSGMVLVAAGLQINTTTGASSALSSAELYNPSSGTFSATGGLSTARSGHTATLLNSGIVLVAGGTNTSNATLSSAEQYNATTGTFSATGSLNAARSSHSATLLSNGKRRRAILENHAR